MVGWQVDWFVAFVASLGCSFVNVLHWLASSFGDLLVVLLADSLVGWFIGWCIGMVWVDFGWFGMVWGGLGFFGDGFELFWMVWEGFGMVWDGFGMI